MPREEAGFAGYYLQKRVVGILARWLGPYFVFCVLAILLAVYRPHPAVTWPIIAFFFIGFGLRKRFENTVGSRVYSWRTGRDSEWEVSEALAAHLGDDFYVLNDVELPGLGGNIDHLVVGPSGIHVIETKGIVGRVDATTDRLLINGYPQDVYLRKSKAQRSALRRFIKDALPSDPRTYPIFPVLVFTRASEVRSRGTTDGVCVEDIDGLLRLLDKYSGSRRIDELHRAQVFHALAPHVASAGKRLIQVLSG
ncbi:MAG: NERD domain-containing protein [Coriobacteriia bacterium]|nr:NERD domain-containing protein [Coriobacteriia bacterium]